MGSKIHANNKLKKSNKPSCVRSERDLAVISGNNENENRKTGVLRLDKIKDSQSEVLIEKLTRKYETRFISEIQSFSWVSRKRTKNRKQLIKEISEFIEFWSIIPIEIIGLIVEYISFDFDDQELFTKNMIKKLYGYQMLDSKRNSIRIFNSIYYKFQCPLQGQFSGYLNLNQCYARSMVKLKKEQNFIPCMKDLELDCEKCSLQTLKKTDLSHLEKIRFENVTRESMAFLQETLESMISLKEISIIANHYKTVRVPTKILSIEKVKLEGSVILDESVGFDQYLCKYLSLNITVISDSSIIQSSEFQKHNQLQTVCLVYNKDGVLDLRLKNFIASQKERKLKLILVPKYVSHNEVFINDLLEMCPKLEISKRSLDPT
eukprot:gene7604-11927_t